MGSWFDYFVSMNIGSMTKRLFSTDDKPQPQPQPDEASNPARKCNFFFCFNFMESISVVYVI